MRRVSAFRFQPGLVLALLAFSAMAPLDPAEVQPICVPRPLRIKSADIDTDGNVDLTVFGLHPNTDGIDIAVAFGDGAGAFSDCDFFSYVDPEPPFLPSEVVVSRTISTRMAPSTCSSLT